MQTQALDELTRRVAPGVHATLDVNLGQAVATIAGEHNRRRQFLADMHAINFPAVLFPVTAGALTVPVQSALLGPEEGQVWDVRRVTLAGWTTADAAINVNLFREVNSPTAGNPQNRLRKFNDSAPGNEVWSPGGGLVLHSPDALLIVGSGFTTTTGIYLTLEGVAFAAKYEADYLI